MSVRQDLYDAPRFSSEDSMNIPDKGQEVKGFGSLWKGLTNLTSNLWEISNIPQHKVLSSTAFFFHRAHGLGGFGVNEYIPSKLSAEDAIYEFFHLFYGVGFYIALGLVLIDNYAHEKGQPLNSIVMNDVALSQFCLLVKSIWARSKVQAGLSHYLDIKQTTLQTKHLQEGILIWFSDPNNTILNRTDPREDPKHTAKVDVRSFDQAARDPSQTDVIYMLNETDEQKRIRRINSRRKLMYNWIYEAEHSNKRNDPHCRLTWPFWPDEVTELIKGDSNDDNDDDGDDKPLEITNLPPPLTGPSGKGGIRDEKKDDDDDEVQITSKTLNSSTKRRKESEQEDDDGDEMPDLEPSAAGSGKRLKKESVDPKGKPPMTIEEYYAWDQTTEMPILNEYRRCLASIANTCHSTIESVEESLLLRQTFITQVFFAHWVSLKKFEENILLRGSSAPARIVRKEMTERRQEYEDYMIKLKWL